MQVIVESVSEFNNSFLSLIDVDECSPTSDCMHKCENFVGGYKCSCDKFFKIDPNDPKKCTRKSMSKDQTSRITNI